MLHALVDSLYVQKPDATCADYESAHAEIEARTRLPLAIEAIYRYVVFLPSRQFEKMPVPNRFFSVAENGDLKVRGLELRRHDTPPLVARMQQEALEILSEAHDFAGYAARSKRLANLAATAWTNLGPARRIEELIMSKRLTGEPREYRKPISHRHRRTTTRPRSCAACDPAKP